MALSDCKYNVSGPIKLIKRSALDKCGVEKL